MRSTRAKDIGWATRRRLWTLAAGAVAGMATLLGGHARARAGEGPGASAHMLIGADGTVNATYSSTGITVSHYSNDGVYDVEVAGDGDPAASPGLPPFNNLGKASFM